MLAEAAVNPPVLGVVGYVALHEPARAADRLATLRAEDAFVGVRNLIHDQADPDWLLRDDVAEGLRLVEAAGLPFDLVAVLPRHLEHGGLSSRSGSPDLADRDRPPGQTADRQ